MPKDFDKTKGLLASYLNQVGQIRSNLSDAGDVASFALDPNSYIHNDYNTSDVAKQVAEIDSGAKGRGYFGTVDPSDPSPSQSQRSFIRKVNSEVLPDLVNRAQMMNPLNEEAQRKAIVNDLINQRTKNPGKVYDFPVNQGNPSIRHSENDFIDKIVRSQAAKKMEQEGAEKVVSSFLDARRGILEGLKKTGKLGLKALPMGLKALPVVGAIADIAMTPTIGEGSDKPIGPPRGSKEFKKMYEKK